MESSKLLPLIANSWNVTPNGDDIFGQSRTMTYTFLPAGELPVGHSEEGFLNRNGHSHEQLTAFTQVRIDAALRAMNAWAAVVCRATLFARLRFR
jgi:hypothetical protein